MANGTRREKMNENSSMYITNGNKGKAYSDTEKQAIDESDVVVADNISGIDVTREYSDEFYERFIENFQQNHKRRPVYKFFKRFFDIVASLLTLILLFPLFLIVAIAIKCDSKGPVFFKQKRIGMNGKTFTCIKFRSMKTVAPHETATSCLKSPEQYITRVGRFLRKLSIDELPQFYCSLIGTMSIIGYRPLVVTEQHCNEMRERLGVLKMRPGISGYAQVHGRDDVYYKNKAILDAEYVKNASLWGDFKLLFSTVKVILTRKGNDSEKLKTCNSSESQTECEVIQSEHIADVEVATAATVDPLDKAN